MNQEQAPVSAGEKYDVWIKAVGEKGDGIARVSGFVLFVSGVKKGDYVKIEVTKVLKNAGFAKVIERLEKPAQQPRKRKYETISAEEFYEPAQESSSYEETEDFGSDLDDDE